jgi:hypothetical protein
MTSEERGTVSDATIASTAEKLAAFARTLTPAEQAALWQVLVRAAHAGHAASEVTGYFTLIESSNQNFILIAGLLSAALLGAFAADYQTGGSGHGTCAPTTRAHGVVGWHPDRSAVRGTGGAALEGGTAPADRSIAPSWLRPLPRHTPCGGWPRRRSLVCEQRHLTLLIRYRWRLRTNEENPLHREFMRFIRSFA